MTRIDCTIDLAPEDGSFDRLDLGEPDAADLLHEALTRAFPLLRYSELAVTVHRTQVVAPGPAPAASRLTAEREAEIRRAAREGGRPYVRDLLDELDAVRAELATAVRAELTALTAR